VTNDELARGIVLRGIMACRASGIDFTPQPGLHVPDDFSGPWEELPKFVREEWVKLAGLVHRMSQSEAWKGLGT
jgi:hypothetical protein